MRRPLAALAALSITACGSPARAPAPPAPAPPAPPTAPPAPAPVALPDDGHRVPLNLDFEQVDGTQAKVWKLGVGVGGPRGTGALDDDAHGGAHSFRLERGADPFGSAVVTFDALALRGKRVRLHGWIKTADVAGGSAALWIRADGGDGAFDNMDDRGPRGTVGWTEAIAQIDVPAGAEAIALGALIGGTGTAWFDDLWLEITDVPPPHPVAIGGTVVDATGAPVAGAQVALVDARRAQLVAETTTGADGRFGFTATSGRYALSALHPGLVGGFVDEAAYQDDTSTVELALARDGGVTVRGTATVVGGALPAGLRVIVGPYSDHTGDQFALPLAADGSFTGLLPRGDRYVAAVRGERMQGALTSARAGDEVTFALPISIFGEPPAAVVDWLRDHAAALATADPEHDLSDLAPLAKVVGKARVVGLGEATHGTREFFQLKHRVLRYLVEKQGFTVFAIEANQPECRALNDYVLYGTGDPQAGLNGLYFWTWNTEEVLAMIEWMRAWNADPRHKRKVQFTGFDMQFTEPAIASVTGFVKRVAPAEADALMAPFAKDAAPDARTAGLAALVARFYGDARAWRKAAGAEAFEVARHDLRVLEQEAAMTAADATPNGGYDARDAAMAENAAWILAHQPRGTRMVLWAHNGHINTAPLGVIAMPMGSHLRKRFGKDYVTIGFGFGEGSFQAIKRERRLGLQEHTLGPAPAIDASTAFTRTGHPIVLADLRAAPRGVVADWFAAPHPMRETGAVFFDEAAMTSAYALAGRFDAVIFVDKTTRARPLPGGQRPPQP